MILPLPTKQFKKGVKLIRCKLDFALITDFWRQVILILSLHTLS